MITLHKYYDGTILNLSGLKAHKSVVDKCRWLQRHPADAVREVYEPNGTIITAADCEQRAAQLVAMAQQYEDVVAVWLRPIKTNPLLHSIVETAFLNAGFAVVCPAETHTHDNSDYPFDVQGWWERKPELFNVWVDGVKVNDHAVSWDKANDLHNYYINGSYELDDVHIVAA